MYQAGQLKQIHERCFYAIGGGGTALTAVTIMPFLIPKEARFVSIILMGPGGGGAGGATGSAGTTRSGGGGGGAGGTMTGLFSARTLPSTIFLILPPGGVGGAANSNATAATAAAVVVNPSALPNLISNQLLEVNFGGAGLVAGTGGATANATTIAANALLAARALSINTNGNPSVGGTGGAAGSPGASVVLACISSPGAGGGSTVSATPSNGGSVTTANATNIFYTASNSSILVQGGVTATPLDGAQGIDNIISSIPFGASMNSWYSLGGAGGASIDSGTGGNGGFGAVGSGGGGGGAGSTGGAGGDGGPSFCLIEWW